MMKQISEHVEIIKSYRDLLDKEAKRLRPPELTVSFDKANPHHWCLSVVGDSLVRIRLLIEQSFQFVESLGIVAASRYLFELSIWLNLFNKDERYGLLYYDQLIDTQKNYYQSTLDQFKREIALLEEFAHRDEKELDGSMKQDASIEDVAVAIRNAEEKIDREAARKFSIYAEQAKYNGYGFQACLVKQNSIPPVESALLEIAAERDGFNKSILPIVSDLALDTKKRKKRWNWKEMAKEVGLDDEYDYIYSFSSKILHATPASITTNQKNLEAAEMLVFLKYIEVKLADLLDISKRYNASATLQFNQAKPNPLCGLGLA
ncbi:hypothetical protein ACIPR8_06370 [Stenotrophomonas sp. LARHCG68]